MPAGRPSDYTQDKSSVIYNGDLYVFGDTSIEVWPDHLPLDHPVVRDPDNSYKINELGFELND